MAKDILILGDSGSGKTTSYRNLPPAKTFIFNLSQKPLPFKGSAKNYVEFNPADKSGNMYSGSQAANIINIIGWLKTQSQFKYIIMDDGNYQMQYAYIKRAKEKGYDKYTDFGTDYANIITALKGLPDDKYIIVSMHTDTTTDATGNKITKPKTVGALVDKYLTVEGMFTVVLGTKVKILEDNKKHYVFETQTDGTNVIKSPMEMLEEEEPNDLAVIIKKIHQYYNG